MATTHRSDLVDGLEKALRDEAYDGGFGYMGDEQFTAYVRGLAVTAAKVVEEVHTPSDDEREALLTEADALVASWDQKGSWSSDSPVGMVMRLAAALRRSEVSEPSAERLDYYDPARQNRISEHDCVFEDGEWWFGHGMPCMHPKLHAERQGEPSFAEARAALAEWERPVNLSPLRRMRAALRAAGGAR